MPGSLREFVRSILLEGSQTSGKTTRQWWANKGVTYTGSQADQPYFVLTDAAGNEITGDVTFPGDPYTYRSLSSGRLQVVSGPTQKSIGASVARPSPTKKPTAAPEDDGSPVDDAAAKQDKKKDAALAILQGLGHVFKAASGMWSLKEAWLANFQSLGPDVAMRIKDGVIGDYTDNLAEGAAGIEAGIGELLRTKNAQPLVDALKIAIQATPDEIQAIENEMGESPFRSNLSRAKILFSRSASLLGQSQNEEMSDEAKGLFETAMGVSEIAKDQLYDENTRGFFMRGIMILDPGAGFSRVAAGGSIPSIGMYSRPDLDRLVGLLLSDGLSSETELPGVP